MSAAPCPKESINSAERAAGRALEVALMRQGGEAPRSWTAAPLATRSACSSPVATRCHDSTIRGRLSSWRGEVLEHQARHMSARHVRPAILLHRAPLADALP